MQHHLSATATVVVAISIRSNTTATAFCGNKYNLQFSGGGKSKRVVHKKKKKLFTIKTQFFK